MKKAESIIETLLILLFLVTCREVCGQKRIKLKAQSKIPTISRSDCNPKAVFLVKPIFPATAKFVNLSGEVQVQILIEEKGNVEYAKASRGHPFLRSAAEKAALKSKFEPKSLSSGPVKARTSIVYSFGDSNSP